MPANKVDIIIISYNSYDYNLKCIESIYAGNDYLQKNIIVVDNASTDDSPAKLKSIYPDMQIIENNENLGYATAVNIGVNAANSDYFIISNSDVEYYLHSIKRLIDFLKTNDNVAATGPQQIFPNGKWQRSYGDFPGIKLGLKNFFLISHFANFFNRLLFKKRKKPKEVSYLDGAVMAINRTAFDSVNGFDEDYFFYTEEADFCYKLKKANWKLRFLPRAEVMHHRGGSKDNYNFKKNKMLISSKVLFCKKHLSFQQTKFYIVLEIFYSGNLTVLWFLIYLFSIGKIKQKAKEKYRIFKSFFTIWIDELMLLMGDRDE